MIEGLTALTGPQMGTLAPHKFSLPAGFPANMSSKWVEDGPAVIEAQQKEILQGAGVAADGWTPYRFVNSEKTQEQNDKVIAKFAEEQEALGADADKKAKPKLPPPVRDTYVRTVGKKTFVLMMRPRALQQAINKIHADTSRMLVSQEVRGETARANEANDPGIITNVDLRQMNRIEASDEGEDYIRATSGGQPTRLEEAQTTHVG